MTSVVAVPRSVVGDLRRARQRRRLAEVHWVDALYRVYLTGVGGAIAVALLAGAVGDEVLDAAAADRVRVDGPPVLGLVVAAAILLGLRSGSRGGPIAVEAADLHHVLLAPVPRGATLRAFAGRQLRFAVFATTLAGAATGLFASHRFDEGASAAWVASGALCTVVASCLALGAALLASGLRMRGWAATLIGVALVGWAAAAVAFGVPAPTTPVGHIALWPLGFDPLGLIAFLIAAAVLGGGLVAVGGVSLELAERRTRLVGQLRFAVTLQDLRTVMVLRRQLAADLPRSRPWVRLRPGRVGHRPMSLVVAGRAARSLVRWPLSRVIRTLVLAGAAGAALAGVWSGTSPLALAAGLALWVAALDAVEPMAQDIDHPFRRDGYPVDQGRLMVRHLLVPVVQMLVVAGIAVAVAAALTPDGVGALLVGLPALGACATLGAAVSVLMGAPAPFDELALGSPEVAGMRTLLRTVWPLVVACAGTVPLLVGRAADAAGSGPAQAAGAALAGVGLLVVLLVGWVRFRADIARWWAEASAQATATRTEEETP